MVKIANYFGIIAAVFLLSCGGATEGGLQIGFSADSTKIVIGNIAPGGLLQLKAHLNSDTAYQKLVSVLQTPADDDSLSMEISWPGKLILEKDKLLYVPDSPFVKGKHYLVETIINSQFASRKEVVTAEVGHHLKATQKILVR